VVLTIILYELEKVARFLTILLLAPAVGRHLPIHEAAEG